MGSGCEILIAANAFVRQTTPHFGGTSREGLYSVRPYHTPWEGKCKELFQRNQYFFIEISYSYPSLSLICHTAFPSAVLF